MPFHALRATLLLAFAPQQPPTAQELIAQFALLDRDRQSLTVQRIERRISKLPSEPLQAITDHGRAIGDYPVATPASWFAPELYAPVAKRRTLLEKGTAQHTAATRGMRELLCMPELIAEVRFDFATGQVQQRGKELTESERFANYAQGFAPYADHAVAAVCKALANDPEQRRLASYFAHLYADRDGGVYEGVSLFAAWHSGQQLEMPDTDAIAFAQQVRGEAKYTAPLPADRRRDALYGQMRAAFAQYRQYLALRLALAASFVAAAPTLDAEYAPLVRRGHFLWRQHHRDVTAVAKLLAASKDREAFLVAVDREIAAATECADQEREELQQLADSVRAITAAELAAAAQ